VLYELLTDELPFRGNMSRIVQQLLQNDPPSPRQLNGYIPRDLETICLKCMEKQPPKRYQTASAVAEELGRFLANEPIRARPVSRAERLWRAAQRRPMLATMIATTITLLVVLAIGGVSGYLHERAMRRDLGEALLHEEELTASLRKLVEFVKNGERVGRYEQAVEAAAAQPQLLAALRRCHASEELQGLRVELRSPRAEDESSQGRWIRKRQQLIDHPDRAPLQSWLDRRREGGDPQQHEEQRVKEVFAWFVQDENGIQIARSPRGVDNIGNCYAWRSYFHGGRADYADLREYLRENGGKWRHLAATQVSMAFKTRQTNEWVVAISTPVYAEDNEDIFLGVVGVFLYVTPPEKESE
jgi:hypothetical protein